MGAEVVGYWGDENPGGDVDDLGHDILDWRYGGLKPGGNVGFGGNLCGDGGDLLEASAALFIAQSLTH